MEPLRCYPYPSTLTLQLLPFKSYPSNLILQLFDAILEPVTYNMIDMYPLFQQKYISAL